MDDEALDIKEVLKKVKEDFGLKGKEIVKELIKKELGIEVE